MRGGADRGFIDSIPMRVDAGGYGTESWTAPRLAPHRTADRRAGEIDVPLFAGYPIPWVAQMLWFLSRYSGIAPPWRVRVSPFVCARWGGLRVIARAFAPHAQIVMTHDGRSPAPMVTPGKGCELVLTDQLHHVANATPDTRRRLWTPDTPARTTRTTESVRSYG